MKKVISILFFALVGCSGTDNDPNVFTELCTVKAQGESAVITCPDGSEIVLPPQIIREEIEVITEIPVLIEMPKSCGKKRGHNK